MFNYQKCLLQSQSGYLLIVGWSYISEMFGHLKEKYVAIFEDHMTTLFGYCDLNWVFTHKEVDNDFHEVQS